MNAKSVYKQRYYLKLFEAGDPRLVAKPMTPEIAEFFETDLPHTEDAFAQWLIERETETHANHPQPN
jgi:hypothetical protein